MTAATHSQRSTTELDIVAESWLDTRSRLDPVLATTIGQVGHDSRFGDYSPDGHDEFIREAKRTRDAVRRSTASDAVDEITARELLRTTGISIDLHEAGWHLRDVNVIHSPVQHIRAVFDLMPSTTVDDWSTIALRMMDLPRAILEYISSLREGARTGIVPSRRQVLAVAEQAARYAAGSGFFAVLGQRPGRTGTALPAALASRLDEAISAARTSYAGLTEFLRAELAPRAAEHDSAGRDLYTVLSHHFLGARIDLDECYAWGLDELELMADEQRSTARQISGGGTVAEAVALLDADPRRLLRGTEALRHWMQRKSDEAIDELGRTHFDIPAPLRRLECRIAPTTNGSIYYTPPSADFSRPGRMWWSVPAGVETFSTWRELSIVYHEGVPGHHLQIGQAVGSPTLNSWRRLLGGTSGHGEGWALYAERLMEQLGHLDEPGDRLGMLDGQRMRAARVVIDIGLHLGKRRPDGRGTWNAEYARRFLRDNVTVSDALVDSEIERYLGWPGQAPAYKVGQRVWQRLRDDHRRKQGKSFDIRAFHRNALALGGVGLDTLPVAVLD